jgi:hypothetical protein
LTDGEILVYRSLQQDASSYLLTVSMVLSLWEASEMELDRPDLPKWVRGAEKPLAKDEGPSA